MLKGTPTHWTLADLEEFSKRFAGPLKIPVGHDPVLQQHRADVRDLRRYITRRRRFAEEKAERERVRLSDRLDAIRDKQAQAIDGIRTAYEALGIKI